MSFDVECYFHVLTSDLYSSPMLYPCSSRSLYNITLLNHNACNYGGVGIVTVKSGLGYSSYE